ncbi:hypothetical protein SAMN05877838_0583 [Hoeflea halophila]|uniref:Uncharacterized protein n=1 Tax=Hoeflea halophila TaxID=714899 RepID=A0A286HM62_9HYPH|nr:hypothetical protein SAMN05877838_0583 [Hoeflea halophila]
MSGQRAGTQTPKGLPYSLTGKGVPGVAVTAAPIVRVYGGVRQ